MVGLDSVHRLSAGHDAWTTIFLPSVEGRVSSFSFSVLYWMMGRIPLNIEVVEEGGCKRCCQHMYLF